MRVRGVCRPWVSPGVRSVDPEIPVRPGFVVESKDRNDLKLEPVLCVDRTSIAQNKDLTPLLPWVDRQPPFPTYPTHEGHEPGLGR